MRKPSITALAVLFLAAVAVPGHANDSKSASDEFTANVDFTTLSLTPVGVNCLL